MKDTGSITGNQFRLAGGTESCQDHNDEVIDFDSIPHPDTWDASWVRRVARFTAKELCIVHRQYAAAAALLYPKADAYGPSSAHHHDLLKIHDRYMCFLHR